MDAAIAIRSRLIGVILVEKGLITGEQLEDALRLQQETGERLGEIVVAAFGVSRLELASVLAEQWAALESPGGGVVAAPERAMQPAVPLMPADVPIRRPIGEIFVELGFITSDQLDAALVVQRETGSRIGEILVEQGSLSRLDLASALAEQWSVLQKLRPPEPAADPQPWQNGVPVPQPVASVWSADERAAVAALEERLGAVERAAGAARWQEDLRLVTADVRSAMDSLEERLGAATPGATAAELATAVAAVNERIEALEGSSASAELAALRGELEELRSRPVTVDGLADLRDAVERLEGRPDLAGELAELRRALTELSARTEADARAEEAFRARIEEVAATVPRPDELAELRSRLDELSARAEIGDRPDHAGEIAALALRLEQLAARVEDVALPAVPDLGPMLEGLAARVDGLASAFPAAEAEGLAARIESLEEAGRVGNGALERLTGELGELGSRTQKRLDELAGREPDLAPVDELRARVDELVASTTREPDTSLIDEIRARLEELATAVERDESVGALEARQGELEQRLDAATPTEELRKDHHALRARVDEVAARLQGLGGVEDAIAGLRESLEGLDAVRVGDALATGARLTGLEAALDSVAGLEARIREGDDLADRSRLLAARVEGTESRLVAVDALAESVSALSLRMAEADRARVAEQQELGNRVDEAVGAIRPELEVQAGELRSELEAQRNETAALRARLEELHESVAGRESHEARVESMLEQRLAGFEGRFTDEAQEARAQAAEAVAAAREETGLLAARIEELRDLRQADAQTARVASGELAARVDALAGLRELDAEVATAAATDLSGRFESLAEALHAEAAVTHATADALAARLEERDAQGIEAWEELRGELERVASVAAQIGDLRGLRADDLAEAELAAAELAARLDDQAVRSVAAALEVEQALRMELGGVAARLEERDAQGIEAREELRGELERVASSIGWRLERIEESLAADDTVQLKGALAELERRLEGQAALGAEQLRATERALRKGLASLGERLVGGESAYLDAGNALRRSIERLGAAVVEADARMADQIPLSEAEGCVAFAPTAAGYRLVELPGRPPKIGSTVELESCDGPLTVTRYGRSPLPLDSRPCAYLDRV